MVMRSTPASLSNPTLQVISSSVSPTPTIRDDLVRMSGRNALACTEDFQRLVERCTCVSDRCIKPGTHSTLCANTASGLLFNKCLSATWSPARSEQRSSSVTLWCMCVNGINALFVMVSSAIGQVVSVDHRDDGMTQVHRRYGLSEVRRLLRVKRRGSLDGTNGTKTASSGAFLASDHECCIA